MNSNISSTAGHWLICFNSTFQPPALGNIRQLTEPLKLGRFKIITTSNPNVLLIAKRLAFPIDKVAMKSCKVPA